MATLAARLSNTGVYSVARYFDEVSNIPITYQFNSGLSTGNSFFIDNGNINWPYFNLILVLCISYKPVWYKFLFIIFNCK